MNTGVKYRPKNDPLFLLVSPESFPRETYEAYDLIFNKLVCHSLGHMKHAIERSVGHMMGQCDTYQAPFRPKTGCGCDIASTGEMV